MFSRLSACRAIVAATAAVLLITYFAEPLFAGRLRDRLRARRQQQCSCAAAGADNAKNAVKTLFDGKTLDGWKITDFGGQGEVKAKDGTIVMDFGASMTGVTYKGDDLPTMDYELTFEAMRDDGSDFFATVTFPVAKSHCSFVLGGWGGGVVGLSNVNHYDASENDTTQYMEFKNKQWYKIRVRVTEKKIETWIDDKQMVDLVITGKKIDTRIECDLSKPLGFATWETRGVLRKIQLKPLEGN